MVSRSRRYRDLRLSIYFHPAKSNRPLQDVVCSEKAWREMYRLVHALPVALRPHCLGLAASVHVMALMETMKLER